MRWYALPLLLGAFLCVGFATSATAQTIAGTTWVSAQKIKGGFATITFTTDGKFEEAWKKTHTTGTWQASADNQIFTVYNSKNETWKFTRTADGNLIRNSGGVTFKPSTPGAAVAADDADSAPPAPDRNVPTVRLTEDQARAVVLIKGDNAEGTGFLIKTTEGPTVVTNQHVIANNPNLKITTTTGAPVTIVSYKGATDRDLAMISIAAGDFKYLDLATDVGATVQPGDEVITPGNSEGGEVMLNTDGKVLGVGPDRVEVSNPVYHGNSGGPVFQVKSSKVIGVVTEAIKVDVSDELDKASFANRDSAIRNSMRYFGLRLDTVATWETLDERRFQNETAFLDQFDKRSQCLDSFLNGTPAATNESGNGKKHKKKKDTVPGTPPVDAAFASLYLSDPQIVQANNSYFDQANGADTSQQMDAGRALMNELNAIADTDMAAIQVPASFYGFNGQRAKDEIAYRKAIQAELKEINNNVSRLGSLPRTNH